nr:MAG TPA: hypothetical protein [Caudoviricetes sp.]
MTSPLFLYLLHQFHQLLLYYQKFCYFIYDFNMGTIIR